jgi:hypothetical protein
VLVLEGHAQIGLVNAFVGEAIFVEADQASLKVGSHGLKALLAYPGPAPIRGLLQDLDRTKASFPDGELLRSGNHWRPRPARRSTEYAGKQRNPDGGAIVTQLSRVAFIGNSLPRRCGIATFTTICSRRSRALPRGWKRRSWR